MWFVFVLTDETWFGGIWRRWPKGSTISNSETDSKAATDINWGCKKKKKWSLAFFPDHLFASLSEDNPFLGGRWGKFQVVENVNQKKLSVCVFPISSLFPLSIRGFYDLKKKKIIQAYTLYRQYIFSCIQ